MAGEVLFSREGALMVEAALCGAPPGAAGDPARRFLLLALVAAAPAVHGTCAAEPGAATNPNSTHPKANLSYENNT